MNDKFATRRSRMPKSMITSLNDHRARSTFHIVFRAVNKVEDLKSPARRQGLWTCGASSSKPSRNTGESRWSKGALTLVTVRCKSDMVEVCIMVRVWRRVVKEVRVWRISLVSSMVAESRISESDGVTHYITLIRVSKTSHISGQDREKPKSITHSSQHRSPSGYSSVTHTRPAQDQQQRNTDTHGASPKTKQRTGEKKQVPWGETDPPARVRARSRRYNIQRVMSRLNRAQQR